MQQIFTARGMDYRALKADTLVYSLGPDGTHADKGVARVPQTRKKAASPKHEADKQTNLKW